MNKCWENNFLLFLRIEDKICDRKIRCKQTPKQIGNVQKCSFTVDLPEYNHHKRYENTQQNCCECCCAKILKPEKYDAPGKIYRKLYKVETKSGAPVAA